MGKVLSTFTHGFPGAIARSLDDVVVAHPNRGAEPLPFGYPVVMNSQGTGVVPFDPESHTAAQFVGVTVRTPSKTPDAYGENEASYAVNELADIMVRGHIAVRFSGNAKVGDAVAALSDGEFGAASGGDGVTLTNAHVSAVPDGKGMAEIVLNTRNLV